MQKEQEDILNAPDFKTLRELAMKAPDFTGRLTALKKTKVDRLTVGAFVESTNTFSNESSEIIEQTFKEAFRYAGELKMHQDNIVKYSQGDSLFQPIWTNKDGMFAAFMFGYQKCIQVNALLMEVNVQLTDALFDAYGGTALSQDEAKALAEAARKARQIADLLEGLDKLSKVKKKEEAP